MSGNTVTAKYLADTSQMEIANDKLAAQNDKLARQVSILTGKASGFNKTYGNSWNAVRARVEQYTKAVKDATNLRDWYAAVEKLQEASAQFKVIEGNLKGVIAGESAAVVEVVKLENSYTALKEAIDRTKKARDGSIAGSSEYNVLTDKLLKLEQAYDRVAAANKRAAGGQSAKMASDAAKQALYKHRSTEIIEKDLASAERELFVTQAYAGDYMSQSVWDGMTNQIQRYRKELELARQAEAAYKKTASSGGGTSRKVDNNSEEGLQKQIGFLEKKRAAIGPGAEFDRLNGVIAKLQVRLKAVKDDAKKAGEALSEAATAPIGSFRRVEYELKKAKEQLELLTYGTKEYIQQSQKVDTIAAEYRKLDKDINKVVKAQKESGGLMGTIGGQAKTLVMTYVGMHEVVSQMTEEWEKQRQIQLDIAERGLGVEGALVQQAANIGVENIPIAKDWARNNQVDLLASQKDIITLIGTAISGGAQDLEEGFAATAASLRMAVGDKEIAEQMLLGGMTVARMNNSKDYEAAFGQIRSSSKASMATNESEYIKNIMGKAFAMTRDGRNMDGLTSERSLEYMTAASRIMADTTGDDSSTAMAKVFQRTADFAPKESKKLKDGTISVVSPEVIEAFRKSRSFDERLALFRSNKQLGAQWEDRMIEGGPKRLATTLLMNNEVTAQIMKESSDAVVSFAEGAKVFQQAVVEMRAAVPNLVANKVAGSGGEQATSGDMDLLNASARARWDAIWNGGEFDGQKVSAVNLTGWDRGVRMQLWDERRAERWSRAIGRGDAGGNDVTDMINSLRPLIKFEAEAGNKAASGQLQAQLDALLVIADEIKRLNQNVQNRPAAPPVNRAPALPRPAARAPAVN
jgi:hypothetical protein